VSRIRCPGCGKVHVLTQAVEAPFKKRCLRCAESFLVTPDQVQGQVIEAPDHAAVAQGMVAAQTGEAGPSSEDEGTEAAPLLASESQFEIGEPKEKSFAPKTAPVRKKRDRAGKPEPKDNGEGAASEENAEDAWTREQPEEDSRSNSRRPLWPMISMLTAGGLLAAGAAWYLLYGAGHQVKKNPAGAARIAENQVSPDTPNSSEKAGKHDPKSTEQTAAKTDAATSTWPGQEPARSISPIPEVQAQSAAVIKLSAARLAAELAADAEEAKRKYATRTIQVSGLFDRVHSAKPAPALSAFVGGPFLKVLQSVGSPLLRPHAFFAVDGPVVACDLGEEPAPRLAPWLGLGKGQPITVRGVFGTNLTLHDCELLPLAAPADARYLGKEIEIVGLVTATLPAGENREFPMLTLDHDTNAHVHSECFFPKSDEAELKKIPVGTAVTLSAVCSGRSRRRQDEYFVRFDNCRFIYTTAPVAPTLRFDVAQVLRDYEEDLRVALPPSTDAGPATLSISVAQLAKEFAEDRHALAKKYSNRMVTVSGSLSARGAQALVLESGRTSDSLKVQCFFTQRSFRDVDARSSFTIRGLCSGMLSANTLRLDNCEVADPSARTNARSLTADYLPFTPGRTLIYDVVTLQTETAATAVVARHVYSCAEGGKITGWTTHLGRLPSSILQADSRPLGDWVSAKKTRKVSIQLPVHRRRLFAGFVEIGQELTNKDGSEAIDWQRNLKLGAKAGASWNWTQGDVQHQFTVMQFGEHKGRPSAVIKETVTKMTPPEKYLEIRHIYIRDVGEVERQESVRLFSGQMRVHSVMKLIEDEEVALHGKPGPASKSANSARGLKSNKAPGK
jgi:tRNA_anti-like